MEEMQKVKEMRIMGGGATKSLGGKGGKGLFTEAEDGDGGGSGYFRGGLGEYGVSEWAGGGGNSESGDYGEDAESKGDGDYGGRNN